MFHYHRFLICVISVCTIAVNANAEEIQITPDWARKNPGVFEISVGCKFNGSNDWKINLRKIEESEYRIDTVLHPAKRPTDDELRKGIFRRYTTQSFTGGKSKTLTLGYSELAPYEFEPEFRIQGIEKDKEGRQKETQTLYLIRLKDFRTLYSEFSPKKVAKLVKAAEAKPADVKTKKE